MGYLFYQPQNAHRVEVEAMNSIPSRQQIAHHRATHCAQAEEADPLDVAQLHVGHRATPGARPAEESMPETSYSW